MKVKIQHENTYEYENDVFFETHIIKLYPRLAPNQRLLNYNLEISPNPVCTSQYISSEGNIMTQTWFRELSQTLKITSSFEMEIFEHNPFEFFTHPINLGFPFEYSEDLRKTLSANLIKSSISSYELKNHIDYLEENSGKNAINFLSMLASDIHNHYTYQVREIGAPNHPELTFLSKEGSCRDFAVLFIEACRLKGLAARFVSGYRIDNESKNNVDLHAWAEVYIPGGGWKGYDPTIGLAVDKSYIALTASFDAYHTLPITGTIRGESKKSVFTTNMSAEVCLRACSSI